MQLNQRGKPRFVVIGALLVATSVFTKVAYGSIILDRVTGTVGNRTIQLDLMEDGQPGQRQAESLSPAEIPFRRVQITCLNGCVRNGLYNETIIDTPISAFRIDDNSADFVTLWEGGTTYVVRIYRILSDGAEKVFEQSSRTFPQFVYVKAGAPAIILNGEDLSAPIHAGSEAKIWRLTNGTYHKIP